MAQPDLRVDSLVLYKNRPARVAATNDKKIEIQTEAGPTVSVRPKDVTLLHPGPLRALRELQSAPGEGQGEVQAAWELLAGATTTVAELAELAFADYTPQTAWSAWQLVEDGLYFSGDPEAITVHDAAKVAAIQATREAKATEERAWQACLARLRGHTYTSEDERYLGDVVAVAREQREQSRVLKALNLPETREQAHSFLLTIGYWDATVNPYPHRLGVTTEQPTLAIPALPDEPRRDLTHLAAFAIDDTDSTDPDDAISWEAGRLWVHVADVAALIAPDSPADSEARARGANLYLPEGTIHMLPPAVTAVLGLGLHPVSPALSFGIDLNDDGSVAHLEITPSWVRVTRLTYDEADTRLTEAPLDQLYAIAERMAARRRVQGAIELELPEVKIRVVDGAVVIKPLPPLRSRTLVREAMLMAGEAVARYALEQALPIPFTVQDASDEARALTPKSLAEMFALRRLLKPSQQKSAPGPHAGLGLAIYCQVTSPLRRYTDLLIHQQLRAHLRPMAAGAAGETPIPPLDAQAVMERAAEASTSVRPLRTTERLSNQHWKLVYLLQNPAWSGEGIVVEKNGARNLVVIPSLDLETEIYGRPELLLDSTLALTLSEVNLPLLETRFQLAR
ncbi:MAG: RNB domain-containing ribonuclease [Caldilineaceae bacterium]|nr:RNB domain-containing ribonuclease [Caldilineaceae bacterium]